MGEACGETTMKKQEDLPQLCPSTDPQRKSLAVTMRS